MCPPSESPNQSCAVGMGCIESAFLSQSIPCIKDPLDGDLAPLMVFLQYLSQLEVSNVSFHPHYFFPPLYSVFLLIYQMCCYLFFFFFCNAFSYFLLESIYCVINLIFKASL